MPTYNERLNILEKKLRFLETLITYKKEVPVAPIPAAHIPVVKAVEAPKKPEEKNEGAK